jgi:transcriptional regulator with GAF, ATPase, and Fis domain
MSPVRVQSLYAAIDLIGRHTDVGELLPHLASCLHAVVDFDVLSVVVPHHAWTHAHLYLVRSASTPPGSTAEAQSVPVPPLDRARLSAAIAEGHEALVVDHLDDSGEYSDMIAALRGLGQQSACIIRLSTALGPVGLMGFASAREGTYGQCDLSLLQHIGGIVAVAIDNIDHQQQAVARARQLQAERDHWRTLL